MPPAIAENSSSGNAGHIKATEILDDDLHLAINIDCQNNGLPFMVKVPFFC